MVQQRHEMYRPIHKALRHMMFSTAHKLGIADFRDDAEAQDAIASLVRRDQLAGCQCRARRELNRDCPDQTDSSNHVTLWGWLEL